MGAAALQYDDQGEVAWDEMWTDFCELALAGGAPHRGTLLEPVHEAAIAAKPERYAWVLDELKRGLALVTGLPVRRSPVLGWNGDGVVVAARDRRRERHRALIPSRPSLPARTGNQECGNRGGEDHTLLAGARCRTSYQQPVTLIALVEVSSQKGHMRQIFKVCAVLSVVLILMVVPASVYEHRQIADGQNIINIGFINEPAFVNQQNGLYLRVDIASPQQPDSNATTPAAGEGGDHSDVIGVIGLTETLEAEVMFGDQPSTGSDSTRCRGNWWPVPPAHICQARSRSP